MALDDVNGARRVNSSGLYPLQEQVGETQKQKQPVSIWIESHCESFPATPKQKTFRSIAKAWIKEYQESNNCSKKEAKAAFKEKFGCDVPASFWKKALRFLAGADVQIKGKKTTENKSKLYDAVSEEDNPYAKGTKLITNTTKGVTSSNNSYVITKDKDGNSVCRVDYGNNNSKAAQFDEEEVRTPEGKLKSFTTRSYSSDGTSWYKKSEYDDNGNLIKVTETTCDSTGKVIGTKNLNIKDEPQIAGHVSIGTPVDGVNGDPELQKALEDGGFAVIGRN